MDLERKGLGLGSGSGSGSGSGLGLGFGLGLGETWFGEAAHLESGSDWGLVCLVGLAGRSRAPYDCVVGLFRAYPCTGHADIFISRFQDSKVSRF